MNRPKTDEYHQFYSTYIDKVPDVDIVEYLTEQKDRFLKLMDVVPDFKHDYSYAEDKWTIKEVIGHMVDTERVFSYRAMCFSRLEGQPLPSMEQDDYVRAAKFGIDHGMVLELSLRRFVKRIFIYLKVTMMKY